MYQLCLGFPDPCARVPGTDGLQLEDRDLKVGLGDEEDRAMPGYDQGTLLADALVVEEGTAQHFERVAGIGDVGACPVALLRLGDMEEVFSLDTTMGLSCRPGQLSGILAALKSSPSIETFGTRLALTDLLGTRFENY